MDAKLKQQWIEALRSGKYSQAREALHTSKGYCCLGVLCDISGIGAWDGLAYRIPDGCDGDFRELFGELETLRDDLGISNDQEKTLIHMNDSCEMTFSEIANYIEGAI